MSERTGEAESDGHWFAGKDVDVLIYRVNRRPLGSQALFEQRQGNVRAHMSRVLRGLEPVKSGRRFQREWRVGNLETEPDSGALLGMLGWSRTGETLSNYWDSATESWIDRWVSADLSAVAPFAFVRGPRLQAIAQDDPEAPRKVRLSEARYLGVLRHPSFEEKTVAYVLTEMLNRGERAQLAPTVQWAVEPVGNRQEFFNWLERTDAVTELQFVFKRPNPDGESEFEHLFQRLDQLEAEKIRENITARDPDVGLNKNGLLSDPTSLAFIAAAMAAFGFLVGKGRRKGKKVRYDQRQMTLRRRVENVSPEWDAATHEVLNAVRDAANERRRERDGRT